MSKLGRTLEVGDYALTDFNGGGVMTKVEIVERKEVNSGSQSGVLFKVKPILRNGSEDSWYDADWFSPSV